MVSLAQVSMIERVQIGSWSWSWSPPTFDKVVFCDFPLSTRSFVLSRDVHERKWQVGERKTRISELNRLESISRSVDQLVCLYAIRTLIQVRLPEGARVSRHLRSSRLARRAVHLQLGPPHSVLPQTEMATFFDTLSKVRPSSVSVSVPPCARDS